MRRHHLRAAVLAVLAAPVLLAGCGSGPAPADQAAPGQGVGTESSAGGGQPAAPTCPPVPRLPAPPERVVTMDGGAAAILDRLGVGDRIVGTAAPDFLSAFTGDERARLDRIPVLDRRQGNAEVVIAAEPDLVVGISPLSFGGFDGTPTVDRLRQAGAHALVACEGEGPGPVRDIAGTLEFVRQAAGVFGVPERGEQLVQQLESEVAAARPPAGTPPLRVLALSSAPAAGQPLRTQGGQSLTNGIITLAGGQNVAQDAAGDFASLNAEEVVARDPQAILVITGFSPQSDAELIDAIRASPVLAPTTAVRENRVVAVPQSILLSPSVLNGRAVTEIAAGLHRTPPA